MIALNLQGVDFVVANTDAQQLQHSRADRRVQLGPHITQGLGAGAKPEIGRAAAEEAAEELYRYLDGAHMVFITAGMGGGTGTGAAPVIARMARERNILTVGVVTKPFSFEGPRRARAAELGIEELQQYVDTLIVIPNQNLFRLANERTGFREAFKMADHVLYMGVRGVTDLMVVPGLVNLDFADIRTVMAEMGKAMMGTGEADGDNRAVRAAEAAINNPLLEDTSMAGARGLLINITGGDDMTLFEVDQAANRIREEVDEVRAALGLERMILYGQSWGGMLGIEYALQHSRHLMGLVISNMVASVSSYVQYLNQLRRTLPEAVQKQMADFESREEYQHPVYFALVEALYQQHLCRLNPWPMAVVRSFEHLNPLVYQTMQGPNEFVVTGTFQDWDRWTDLPRISVPTLILGGRYDTMNPDDLVAMADVMEHARSVICPNGSHMAMWDDPDHYYPPLLNFLAEVGH